MPETNKKTCPECGTALKGRKDKKFCSDQCRSTYNNHLNSHRTHCVRRINDILQNNRRILIDLNPEGKTKVSRAKLVAKGFDFKYFTSTYINRDGSQYFYCYDQGYLPIEKEHNYLLVVKTVP